MLPAVRRGILGGTFDPPHLAHLVAGEAAHRQLDLDAVTFVPAGAPWQKSDRSVTEATHRWAMTELAVAGVDYFEADDREVHREGWTYTVDTLESYPAGDDLIVVLGADAARGIRTWHRSDEVLSRAEIAVVPRPGVALEDVTRSLEGARWRILDSLELGISGTQLRARVAAGRSIRFLVRDPVWWYVDEHGLYVEG